MIVVGGGPAGSATAMRLARGGRHVVQLERRIFGAAQADWLRSGEGMLPATVVALRRLGLATSAAPWALGHAEQVRIRWPNGRITQDRLPGESSVLTLDRECLDETLWSAAVAAGVDARDGWNVDRLLLEEDRVVGVQATTPDGVAVDLRAPLVIDAGGRNALSIRQLDLRRKEWGANFIVVVLFFDEVPDLCADTWELHFSGRTTRAVVQGAQICDGIVRFGLGADLRLKAGRRLSPQEFFWYCIEDNPELSTRLRSAHQIRAPYARARLGYRSSRIAQGGLLLVGDAIGYISPILGDGILIALRSAELAATIAQEAFAGGGFDSSFLQRYQQRWHASWRMRHGIGRAILLSYQYPRLIDYLGRSAALRRVMLAALVRS